MTKVIASIGLLLAAVAFIGNMSASRVGIPTTTNIGSPASHSNTLVNSDSSQPQPDRLTYPWYPTTTAELDLVCDEALQPGESSLGRIPEKAQALLNALQLLNATVLDTFESLPKFGQGRNAPDRPTMSEPDHTPLPDRDERYDSRNFDSRIHGKFTPIHWAWLWLYEMRGFTARGAVYRVTDPTLTMKRSEMSLDEVQANGGFVISKESDRHPESIANRLSDSGFAAHFDPRERLWDVKSIELVSLLQHDPPVAYEQQPLLMEPRERPKIRILEQSEIESLDKICNGDERVISWNEERQTLRLVSAIRAKENCLKCHDVERGTLLGAFTYAVSEVTRE